MYGPQHEETCHRGFAVNKGADQPEHPGSLISTFVICLLESMISRLTTGEIAVLKLVSEPEQAGLKLTLSETSKTGLVAMRPIYCAISLSCNIKAFSYIV